MLSRFLLIFVFFYVGTAHAFVIEFSQEDFDVSPEFNQVGTFNYSIDVDGGLVTGVYDDPVLNTVVYQVRGTLPTSTPSTFSAFDLQRTIDGADFYGQGSSLYFEVSDTADLSDGLQLSELVPDTEGVIFTFNGREINNGRFHPSLFVLRQSETGTLQNSNNVPNTDPTDFISVDFGEEYITQLTFEDCLTIVSGANAAPQCSSGTRSPDSGGGAVSRLTGVACFAFFMFLLFRRRVKS